MKRKINASGIRNYLQKIIICLVLICSLQISHAQVPTFLQQLYITFGGGVSQDLSLNAFPITTFGAPAPCPDRFGNANCALRLNSGSDYLTIPYNTVFDMINPTDAYSISMWYRGYTTAIGDLEFLFNKMSPTATPIPSDYHLCIYDLNKPYQGYNFSPVTFQPITPGGGWHHLVGMYDNSTALWTLYVDNVPAYVNYAGPAITSSTFGIQIGGGWPAASAGYAGRVDDIVFYNRLLTVAEINQLYVDVNSCAVACGCPVPTGLFFAGCVNPNTSQLQWTGNACALQYQVRIRNVTAATPWVTYTSVPANFSLATIPGNVYQWKVRSQCSNAAGALVNSAWSSNNNFTALACKMGDEETAIESPTIHLYPNPATNEINIESFSDNATITIVDISGKIVLEQKINDYITTISISKLNNGIYFIKIDNGARSETQKFVKVD